MGRVNYMSKNYNVKIVEQIALKVLGADAVDNTKEWFAPDPWYCAMGSRDEYAKLFSWNPEEGFRELDTPKEPRQIYAAASSWDEFPEVEIFSINEGPMPLMKILPEGVYVALMKECIQEELDQYGSTHEYMITIRVFEV